jgi:L-lactate dehydrogenase (cytochrome)
VRLDGAVIVNVFDLREEARRRLPRVIFDYIEGGAESEASVRANRDGFERLWFRPRVLKDFSECDTAAEVLGSRLALPLVFAPLGFEGMFSRDGELSAGRVAARKGIAMTLATLSTCTVEELAKAVPDAIRWFQLYVFRDRGFTEELVRRASASGYSALIVTVDAKVIGNRERDVRNGFTVSPRITLSVLTDLVRRIGWLSQFVGHRMPTFGNLVGSTAAPSRRDALSLGAFGLKALDPGLTWKDLDWIRSLWRGPLALKGVMSAEDARLAVEHGVEAIVVSNHGGRQLDCVPATIDVLPEVVEAVAGRAQVLMDGGIRRGTDVVKAIALGARAVMIGRPLAYGLAASGEAGAERAVEILASELVRTLMNLGCARVADLDTSYLRARA